MNASSPTPGKTPRHEALRHEALALLKSFTTDIVGILDTEELLWAVAEKTISKLGWQDCVIYIKDEKQNLLLQKAAFGPKSNGNHSVIGPLEIPVGHGIVGKVASTGKSMRIGNTALIKDYIVDDVVRMSELAVPIISNNEIIGVIDSEHQDADFFQVEDQLILETIAGITGTKFENSKKTASNESLAQFYKRNPNPVLQIGPDRDIVFINDTAKQRLTGTIETGTLEQPGLDAALTTATEKGHALWQHTDSPFPASSQHKRKNTVSETSKRVTEYHVIQLPNGLFNLYGHDITHILDLQERAESAHDAKSRFLSVMSHEIRTPLNAILGLTDLLIHDNPNRTQQLQHLAYMEFSGQHLLSLVNDILDLEKLASKDVTEVKRPFHLLQLIDNIRKSFQNRADTTGLQWTATLSSDLPEVISADAKWLTQILNNLISNAIKYTEHGHVELKVGLAPQKQTPEQHVIQFSVHDTGRGIPENEIHRIIEPFEQVQVDPSIEGTGLGLSIVNGLVARMNGQLHITSEVNVGSIFTVTLPFSHSPQTKDTAGLSTPYASEVQSVNPSTLLSDSNAGQSDATSAAQPDETCTILLADDNELNRFIACKLLNRWGHEVHEASDGKEAVAMWKLLGPCIILMDIQMPELDGIDAAKQIRDEEAKNSLKRSPILALTADAEDATLTRIFKAQMDDRIIKPFDPPTLRALIQTKIHDFLKSS